jgi:hypothetical protein
MAEEQLTLMKTPDLADIFRIVEKFPQLEASLPQNIREELNK